jgi:parallel beta-helix repeat protein
MLGIGALAGTGTVSAAATTRNVAPSGTDSGDCSTSACKTISYAISKANAGDTIYVANSNYPEGVTITKKLNLQASGAVINALGHDNGILIKGADAAGTVVSGFVINNAIMEGILAMETSNVTIIGNTVQHNDLGVHAAKPVGACAPQGPVPGDCGEAIHLWAVSHSLVSGNKVMDNTGGILLTDETGPTHDNRIVGNTVSGTGEDCGIVLASHSMHIGSPVDPKVGGVYNNTVSGNSVINSGPNGAGVGLFAAPPGASTYNNVVDGNTLSSNGIPGVAMHSHAPFQNLNGNVISNNTIMKNGADPDAGSDGPTGIVIFADVSAGAFPISHERVVANKISDETIGIYVKGVSGTLDLSTNTFDKSVTTPTKIVVVTPPAAGGSTGAPGGQISPPSTGDAGLAATSPSSADLGILALLTGVLALGFLGAVRIHQS